MEEPVKERPKKNDQRVLWECLQLDCLPLLGQVGGSFVFFVGLTFGGWLFGYKLFAICVGVGTAFLGLVLAFVAIATLVIWARYAKVKGDTNED